MPESFPKDLKFAENLRREGKFQEALQVINEIEKKETISPGGQLSLLIVKGRIFTLSQQWEESVKIGKLSYQLSQTLDKTIESITSLLFKANCVFLGQFDKAMDHLLKAEKLLNSLKDISPSYLLRQRANILFKKAWALYLKGEFKIAIETALECLPLQEKLGRKTEIAYTLTLLGDSYSIANSWGQLPGTGDENNINRALDCAIRSRRIFEEVGDKIGLGTSLRLLGTIHFLKGDLDKALKYCKKSYSSKVISPQTKLDNIWWIGQVYLTKGELEKALKYYKQGIPLAEKENAYYHFVQFQIFVGSIYWMKGNSDLATEYLKTGLSLAEKRDIFAGIYIALMYLVMLNVEKDFNEEAEKYLKQWEELEKKKGNSVLSNGYLLGKAYLLKKSSGSSNRAEAEKLLKHIIKEESYPELRTRSLISLCEFYLEEVNLFGDSEILNKIKPPLNQLLNISEEQRMYGTLAEAKLLQAKVAIIQMNFEEAQRLLTQAQRVAEMYSLSLLAKKISSEHDNYLEKSNEWKRLKEREVPISERLKLASVEGVIERLQGKRALEPFEEVEEEPIVLLIIDRSGISYFSYPFIENWDFDWLFSSFMSAFDTFSSEVFSESIDRIKIAENLILINPIESFLICYVIKGQSYSGLQKLNRFSEAIKNNTEIWETLIRAVQTGEELEINKLPSLGAIVSEVFNQ
ncbi:MAG: tetratricopeptide repeat protein [Promethearchaeota archaeon]|jgi:tetratricopeptide (TPR) repeat protein